LQTEREKEKEDEAKINSFEKKKCEGRIAL